MAIVVDSDPRKTDYLTPIKVFQPNQVLPEIEKAKLFVINTRRHAKDILAWIERETGRQIEQGQWTVLDYELI